MLKLHSCVIIKTGIYEGMKGTILRHSRYGVKPYEVWSCGNHLGWYKEEDLEVTEDNKCELPKLTKEELIGNNLRDN